MVFWHAAGTRVPGFGAFLDPVADKVLVAIAMVLVTEHYHSWWVTLPAATMIAREIIISALREWMAELGKRSSVAVSWIGKVKTTAQMVALAWLLWRPNIWVEYAGIALFLCGCGTDSVVNVAIFERCACRFA